MKTTEKVREIAEATDQQISDAIASFNPFGYLDMKAAVNAALQAGKNTDFVYECVEEFCDSTDMKIDQCDPVYCVLDAILQEARNEIDDKIGFDFINDIKNGSIDTHGNFMCSSYDYNEEAKEQLIKVLKKNKIVISELSEATQYFLNEIEIYQDDIISRKKK